MKTSQAGLELIKKYEGFSAKPYICPAGYNTIGYGHQIMMGEIYDQISEAEAEDLLIADVGNAERAVKRLVKMDFTQGQFDALVSFVFNLGADNLKNSTLLKRLNTGDYKGAAAQFSRWIFANGKVMGGLARRREAEMKLFTGG